VKRLAQTTLASQSAKISPPDTELLKSPGADAYETYLRHGGPCYKLALHTDIMERRKALEEELLRNTDLILEFAR
jgi:hypothetical protein